MESDETNYIPIIIVGITINHHNHHKQQHRHHRRHCHHDIHCQLNFIPSTHVSTLTKSNFIPYKHKFKKYKRWPHSHDVTYYMRGQLHDQMQRLIFGL